MSDSKNLYAILPPRIVAADRVNQLMRGMQFLPPTLATAWPSAVLALLLLDGFWPTLQRAAATSPLNPLQ
jgi:hypothetical protein